MSVSLSGRETRAWVEVDLRALVENARTVRRIAGTRLLPVVKANAYGLGAVAVAQALEAVDPWGYGVATPEEGAELRAAGIRRRILVFMPARAELFDAWREHGLTPTLDRTEAIRAWLAGGGSAFHVEIDTGMSRTGARWDDVDGVAALLDTPDCEGCFTQFHSADQGDGSVEAQLKRFLVAVERLPRRPALLHVANSAAALRDAKYALDLVRPGIFLYGGRPGEGVLEPKPVSSVRARVVSVRTLAAGEAVSYGATWTAPRDTTVATLAIGYADGLRRSLGGAAEPGTAHRAHVLLRGRPCPVVGHVTMDLTMVDAGSGPVEVGDGATVIGADGGRTITLQDVARWAGTIPYEVLTGLGPRLPRIYR